MLHEAETEAFGDGSGWSGKPAWRRGWRRRGGAGGLRRGGLGGREGEGPAEEGSSEGEVGQIGSDVSRRARALHARGEIIFFRRNARRRGGRRRNARGAGSARAQRSRSAHRANGARAVEPARGEARARAATSISSPPRENSPPPDRPRAALASRVFRSGANAIGARAHLDTVIEAAIASSELRVRVTSEPYGVSSALLASRAIVDGALTGTTV